MTRVMRKTSEKRTVLNLFSAMQRWTERRLPRPQPPHQPQSPDTENIGVGVKMEASAPHRSTVLASSLPAPDPPPPGTSGSPSSGLTRTLSLPQLERLSRGSPRLSRRPVAVSGACVPPCCDPSPPGPDAAFTRSPLSQHQHHLAVNTAARRVRQSNQPICC